jgi:hypothetical protein
MLKTLQITSIVAAGIAGVFFVLSAAFGLRKDTAMESYLTAPGVVEIFQKNASRSGNRGDAPLVKQAQTLSLRLNPPKPVEVVSIANVRPVFTPQFKLLGTSYCPNEPAKSTALIDDPGKGWRWVAKSDKIGYAEIVDIQDEKIVFTDNGQTHEMLTDKAQAKLQDMQARGIVQPASASGNAPGAQMADTRGAELLAVPEPSPEEQKKLAKENVEFVKQVMAQMKDPNKSEVGAEEAAQLGELGEFLKQVEADANRIDANAASAEPNSIEANAASAEPNSKENGN